MISTHFEKLATGLAQIAELEISLKNANLLLTFLFWSTIPWFADDCLKWAVFLCFFETQPTLPCFIWQTKIEFVNSLEQIRNLSCNLLQCLTLALVISNNYKISCLLIQTKSKLSLFGTKQLLSGVPDIRVPFLGQHLIPVPSVKDLGIILDSNLTVNEHINTLTLSLISTQWQISRVRHLFSKSVLTTFLICLVFSKLSYCWTVWSGTFTHNINKLQLVQNFAARVLTNTKKFDHISPVLRALCWPSIKNQLLVRDLTMLYKMVNGLAPPYLEVYVNKRSAIHSYNTRSRDNLVVPFCRTASAQRSFSYRAITAWNSLRSEETKNSATLSVFKRAVKCEIYDSP